MLKTILASILLIASAPLVNVNAVASDIACPNTIATFQDNTLLTDVTPIMKSVYADLGCSTTKFRVLPARRSLLSFNNGEIDGEVLRIPIIENVYKVEFVRSKTPLTILGGSLWERETGHDLKAAPIAYQLGVVWHERYIKDKRSIPLNKGDDIIDVYNSGKVNKFLGTNYLVTQMIKANKLHPSPIQKEEVVNLKVFHYLHKSYAPFMKMFSDHLIKEQPFHQFLD